MPPHINLIDDSEKVLKKKIEKAVAKLNSLTMIPQSSVTVGQRRPSIASPAVVSEHQGLDNKRDH